MPHSLKVIIGAIIVSLVAGALAYAIALLFGDRDEWKGEYSFFVILAAIFWFVGGIIIGGVWNNCETTVNTSEVTPINQIIEVNYITGNIVYSVENQGILIEPLKHTEIRFDAEAKAPYFLVENRKFKNPIVDWLFPWGLRDDMLNQRYIIVPDETYLPNFNFVEVK